MKFLLILLSASCLELRALYYLGVREDGQNRGKVIKELQRKCGLPVGEKYCGCYVSTLHRECDADLPTNPNWSPSWGREDRIIWRRGQSPENIQEGQTVLIWYNDIQRIGHVGIVFKKGSDGNGDYVIYHSGNTKSNNIIKGEGIHLVKLYLRSIFAIADWITPKGETPVRYHTVESRQNLYRISLQYKTTVAELVRMNNLDSEMVYIGQKLRVE